jgi:hypothetical protein
VTLVVPAETPMMNDPTATPVPLVTDTLHGAAAAARGVDWAEALAGATARLAATIVKSATGVSNIAAIDRIVGRPEMVRIELFIRTCPSSCR